MAPPAPAVALPGRRLLLAPASRRRPLLAPRCRLAPAPQRHQLLSPLRRPQLTPRCLLLLAPQRRLAPAPQRQSLLAAAPRHHPLLAPQLRLRRHLSCSRQGIKFCSSHAVASREKGGWGARKAWGETAR